ncbi:hypothetical protein FOMG_02133 [Fusarium oxysporum f. sp. melonis 26406]|uniref:Uncharacterized protein n=1 Tax=Fusarium oxysporum f. sp. melonis 26406 TaxID=1089452 RepID=X0AZL7_FUSOX|nr:hypothetical protein FOMG_02133 [Fusarium oxysporum f. sp. melonis 26406]
MASQGNPPQEPAERAQNSEKKIPPLCRDFQKSRCQKGKDCRFTHDPETVYLRQPTMEASKLLTQLNISLMRYNLDNLSPVERSEAALKLWKKVLVILDSPYRGQHQEVARTLAGERYGSQCIIATVKDILGKESWNPSSTPFIQVLAHSSLLNCSAVESDVNTIYSTFSGKDGQDGMNLMFLVYRSRLDSIERASGSLSSEGYKTVLCEIRVCHELVRRAPRSQLRTTKSRFLDLLDKLVARMCGKFPRDNLDEIIRRLDIIKRLAASPRTHLALSDIPRAEEQDSQHHLASIAANFDRPGGRHDNDFADIADVAIFPTTEEVIRVYEDYIPSTNFSDLHVLGDLFQRYIDSMFRLIRHDTMGPVVKVLRDLCKSGNPTAGRLYQEDIRADTYLGCRVHDIFQSQKQELQVSFTLLLPQEISNQSVQRQKEWWKYSAPLEEGRLLCFVSQEADHQHILFFQVASKNHEHLETSNLKPRVTAKVMSHQRSTITQLARLLKSKTSGVLVDFHSVLPDTFMPMLDNLQRIRLENHLPFYKWLTPSEPRTDEVPPPLYARREGFAFPLSCISKDKDTALQLYPAQGLHGVSLLEVEKRTGLDSGQCQGLVAALTREYALIQGPPGTGKSYLGVQLVRVLLAVKKQANLGPIVVSCDTNHALDQFLKHLDDIGVNNIVRIGNRSTTSELRSRNLVAIRAECLRTLVESSALEKLNASECRLLADGKKAINELIETRSVLRHPGLMSFISETYPRIHKKFLPKRRFSIFASTDALLRWLGKRPSAVESDVQQLLRRANHDIHALSTSERWVLADHWAEAFIESKVDTVLVTLEKSKNHRKDVNNILNAIDQRTLSKVDVIGITTSNAARKIDLLKSLSPKVMICEEAAEVTEPHLISALIPGLEHLIQIGDHKQLRPKLNDQKLGREMSGKKWQLDRSQFERRAEGEDGLSPVEFAQLNVQRRMRPEISQLISTVYPKLQDHPSVLSYPDVVGMRHNVFWLDHNQPEAQPAEGPHASSYCNRWEIEMATALVRHLVQQGEYQPEDIALLTPYTSQLCALKRALSEEIEISIESVDSQDSDQKIMRKRPLSSAVRLATVDNFQGEEAKVVIISLVRSNPRHKMGFLKTSNRINVLLSRARHGMYLIGDVNIYRQFPMWNDVYHKLSDAATVGTKLELCCPRHPDTIALCSKRGHFNIMSPEGGCDLPCAWQLEPCGHKCKATCHSEAMHQAVLCLEPCSRIRTTCNHECPKRCGQSCGPCMVPIQDVKLSCGHVAKLLPCHKTLDLYLVECQVKVTKTIPKCGHDISIACSESVTSKDFCFPHSCNRSLASCDHTCTQPCHGTSPCGDCQKACEVRCAHSSCSSTCSQACVPCIEQCTWACSHQGSCSMPCSAPCDRLPCDRRCEKSLDCGHRCPSFCGEDCPAEYCQECSNKKETKVDLLEGRLHGEVDLDKNPIVVLGCGHFFTGRSLDSLLGLDGVYLWNNNGQFLGLKDLSGSFSKNMPLCPTCNQPIRQYAPKRYNRLINRAIMDETTKQFLVKESNELYETELKLRELEQKPSTVWPELDLSFRGLKESARKVEARAEQHIQQTKPLFDAITMAQTQHGGEPSHVACHSKALTSSQLTPGEQIGLRAQLLFIRVTGARLYGWFSHSGIISWVSTDDIGFDSWLEAQALPTLPEFLCDCKNLIERAKDANLPRLAIIGTLSFTKIAHLLYLYWATKDGEGSKKYMFDIVTVEEQTKTACELLNVALVLCSDLRDGEELEQKVQDHLELFHSRHEDITPGELAPIKSAMASGTEGMATNSGHWYNCVNGHPFAAGDCGMPTEVARCPECGASVGGSNYRPLDGVTRAEEMETEETITEEPNELLEMAVP